MSRRASRRRARAPPVWLCPRPDLLARAGPARAGPSRAAPLGWLRLAAVMGGTLVTHGGDIATACHQRPAHHVVRGRGGARAVRDASAPRIGPESAPRRAEAPRARSASD